MGFPQPARATTRPESAAAWVPLLWPLGARLAGRGCECGDPDELRHQLGHVLKFAAEALDADEDGKTELSGEDRALLERVRDVMIGLL
jgi:hypothetical protein